MLPTQIRYPYQFAISGTLQYIVTLFFDFDFTPGVMHVDVYRRYPAIPVGAVVDPGRAVGREYSGVLKL